MLIEQFFFKQTESSLSGLLYAWGAGNFGQVDQGIISIVPKQLVDSLSWTAISAGRSHSAAIRSDGLLFVWGDNASGQLGDNTVIAKSSPVQIGSSTWTTVSAGLTHTVAIRSDGYLFTWGGNLSGQLGTGNTSANSSPVQIGSSSWSVVSAGREHTAAIRSGGTLFTWGRGTSGELGDLSVIGKSSPVLLAATFATSSWTAVSAGGSHTVAIRSGGTIFSWGLGTSGQLGDYTLTSKSSPVLLGSSYATSSWTAVSAGVDYTAAIRSGGTLFTWGLNTSGQLGRNDVLNESYPVQIGSSSWVAVSASQRRIAAIRSGGTLFTWGHNTGNGVLGDGSTIGRSSPVQIGSNSWTAVSINYSSAAIKTDDQTLWTWGYFPGKTVNLITPQEIVSSSSWTAISAGFKHTAAIRSDGILFAWGDNQYGQLGNGNIIPQSSPVQIGSSSWIAVSAGPYNTAAIRSGGTLFTWGRNDFGQLGDNSTTNRSSPVLLAATFASSSWTAVSAGRHTAAIRSGGTLFTWGNNSIGQLGDGSLISRSSPGLLQASYASSSWTAVSTGGGFGIFGNGHTAAIRSDGYLFTWGNNSNGQLGDSSIIEKSVPTQIGSSSWTAVSAGFLHTAAIRSGGTLFTWGSNLRFQLGDGTAITQRSSPVVLATSFASSSWTAVSSGQYHTVAIRSDNALFAWGRGYHGQLGIGIEGVSTDNRRTSPVVVGTLSWSKVSAGGTHTVGVTF